jgi:hypothetical protein
MFREQILHAAQIPTPILYFASSACQICRIFAFQNPNCRYSRPIAEGIFKLLSSKALISCVFSFISSKPTSRLSPSQKCQTPGHTRPNQCFPTLPYLLPVQPVLAAGLNAASNDQHFQCFPPRDQARRMGWGTSEVSLLVAADHRRYHRCHRDHGPGMTSDVV